MMFYIYAVYLLIMSLIDFILMLADKGFAKKPGHRRIRERTLLGFALLGGAVGGMLGMYLARHKTLHKRFAIGLPLLSILYGGSLAAWAVLRIYGLF